MSAEMTPLLLVNGQSGAASWVSPWFDRQKWHLLSWNVWWTAFAATAGTLSLEGTNDPTQILDTTFVPNNPVVPLTITVFHGTWPTVGAIAAAALVNTSEGQAFERLKYTRGAGGTTGQFFAQLFGRPR